jgi:hypothetical protein
MPEVLKPYVSAINDWLEYKREKKQSYKPRGLQAFYTDCIKFGADLPSAIQHSMAKNYAGIYADRSSDRETWSNGTALKTKSFQNIPADAPTENVPY